MWTQQDAIDLCTKVEEICPKFGCHVALTGGCLYKEAPRKDCDLVFYRIRQRPTIDLAGLLDALAGIRLVKVAGSGWCLKARYYLSNNLGEFPASRLVDLLFPEEVHGTY